jgi:hypothetical protein
VSWGGVCAFGAMLLRHFAPYSAALAGYTAAIIVGDELGPVGGVNRDAFIGNLGGCVMLAWPISVAHARGSPYRFVDVVRR